MSSSHLNCVTERLKILEVLWRILGLGFLTLMVALSSAAGAELQQKQRSKILLYPFGHCFNSHLLNAERLTKILIDSGHQVDMVVSHTYNRFDNRHCVAPRLDKLRLIQFHGPDNYVPICEHDTVDFMLYASLKQRFTAFFETSVKYCDALLSDRQILDSLKATNYDLVIVESIDPCSRILVDFLDVPFILLVTTGLGHFDSNPRNPSYLPAAIAPFTTQMNLCQRVLNTILKVMYDQAIPAVIGILTPFEQLKVKHNINTTLSLANSFDRTSIKLVNSDFAIEYPAPIEPDTVLIGGFAVDSPSPLSDDLQKFMDGASEDGVIILSFGTIVKNFEPRWAKIFSEVFARLSTRVIWRNTATAGTNYTLSPNVRVLRWLPQVSLLAHPNTKLVISHCGLNSLFEAVRYSVPILAIPLSGDQLNNAAKVTHLKIGITVDIHTMTNDSLYRDIRKVLDDRQFTVNARQVAQRLADQPLSAAAKIRFWVDYVIRHRGAAHLRSGANRLPWYQYFCLDVLLCLLSVTLAFIVLTIFILLKLFRFAYKMSHYFVAANLIP